MKRKNIIAVALCTAVAFSLGACQHKEKEAEAAVQRRVESESELTQIANPWTDCATIQEAEEKAGFEITVPDQLNGYDEKDISVMEKDMLQVQFSHGEETVYFRKSPVEKEGTDISGDYREADTFEKVEINGRTVTFKEADGRILTAVWTEGDYSYAIGSSAGIEAESMTGLVESLR